MRISLAWRAVRAFSPTLAASSPAETYSLARSEVDSSIIHARVWPNKKLPLLNFRFVPAELSANGGCGISTSSSRRPARPDSTEPTTCSGRLGAQRSSRRPGQTVGDLFCLHLPKQPPPGRVGGLIQTISELLVGLFVGVFPLRLPLC